MDLAGQVIAITGGASGIGLATAEQVTSLGGAVALIDLNGDAAREKAKGFETRGERAIGLEADATDPAAVARAFDAVLVRFGRLDGVVTSAGIRQTSAKVADLSLEVWERILRVDLGGTFVTCQAASRIMTKARTGTIVNVASLSGQTPRVGQAAYCSAKAGVIILTKVLALELASVGVRVNCVCPGTTNTPFVAEALKREGEQGFQQRIQGDTSQYRPGIPLRRIAEANEVADSIVFLLSPRATFITGQALFIDGGESVF